MAAVKGVRLVPERAGGMFTRLQALLFGAGPETE